MVFAFAGDSTMTRSGPLASPANLRGARARATAALAGAPSAAAALRGADRRAGVAVFLAVAVFFEAGTCRCLSVVMGVRVDTIPLVEGGCDNLPYYTGRREVKAPGGA